MRTLFFVVLILRIFRTPLNSSRILSMAVSPFFFFSDAFFYAFAQVLQLLFLFFGHASPLLDGSQDFSIFIKAFFILCCCSRRGHLYFFVVVLEHARASAAMEHDRTCLFDLMWNLCTKMFFWIAFRMLITKWAMFRQSLPCPQVAAAAAAISCVDFVCIFFTSDSHERVWTFILQSLPCSLVSFTAFLFTGCTRPPVRTSMLVLSKTTPLVICFAAALRLLRFSVNKCAFCFCCCCGILFSI